MIAQVCDLNVGDFVHTLGDTHLYLNHIEQAKTQLKRTPQLAEKITDILERNKRCFNNKSQSYSKITAELNRNGIDVHKDTVYKLMRYDMKL